MLLLASFDFFQCSLSTIFFKELNQSVNQSVKRCVHILVKFLGFFFSFFFRLNECVRFTNLFIWCFQFPVNACQYLVTLNRFTRELK